LQKKQLLRKMLQRRPVLKQLRPMLQLKRPRRKQKWSSHQPLRLHLLR
jgi:hypothetical protein